MTTGTRESAVFTGWFPSLSQFELDMEPRLKPSLVRENVGAEEGAGRGGGGVNDSRDVSFTQSTKGRRWLGVLSLRWECSGVLTLL